MIFKSFRLHESHRDFMSPKHGPERVTVEVELDCTREEAHRIVELFRSQVDFDFNRNDVPVRGELGEGPRRLPMHALGSAGIIEAEFIDEDE